jgi:phytoene dehydrogenase-like protein
MGKAGPGASPIGRVGSGRSYWVRDILAQETETTKPRQRPPSEGKKRFVEPQRLTEEQRAALLSELEAASIGDAESRQLFAAALEYDLARFQGAPPEPPVADLVEPQPPEADKALRQLAELARALAKRLSQLDEEARNKLSSALSKADRFHRGYGTEYLDTMQEELLRVAATAPRKAVATRPKKPKHPPLSDSAREFIRRVADAFGDCFETPPTADGSGAFVKVLSAITKATGVGIPTDPQALTEALKGKG